MQRARSHSLFALAGAIALATLSCAHSREAREPEASDTDVTLQVISHTFNVVDVYLYRGSARRYLGTASGHSVSVFRIPWNDLAGTSRIAIVGKSIGDARRVSTGALQVNPGSLITWTLEHKLVRSTAIVH